MEMLENVQKWLGALPFWQGELPEIDKLSVKSGAAGLFPLGVKQLEKREDVLGNVTFLTRYTFLLKKTAVPGMDGTAWCMAVQKAAKQMPPQLGQKDFYAREGSFKKNTSTGLGMYEIQLVAEMEETI